LKFLRMNGALCAALNAAHPFENKHNAESHGKA